jgi:hypothetical protein
MLSLADFTPDPKSLGDWIIILVFLVPSLVAIVSLLKVRVVNGEKFATIESINHLKEIIVELKKDTKEGFSEVFDRLNTQAQHDGHLAERIARLEDRRVAK